MVRFPLTGLIIAVTGDFGPHRSHETLKRWTEKNGGQWATRMCPEVTHLICTKEDYRSKAPMDSLMKGYRLPPRGDYLVARAIKDAKKFKQVKKQTKKATIKKGVDDFKKECQDIQKQLFSDRYQVYHDSTHFAYNIVLVRVNLLQNKSERYVLKVCLLFPCLISSPPVRLASFTHLLTPLASLQLCTTHDVPKYYASLLTYHTRDSPAQKSVLAPVGSDWATAFGAFTSAFQAKTKVEWDERLKPRRLDEDAFVYSPPKDGEPRGEMPEDFNIKVGVAAGLS
ncbi:MAG: hypothetical protein Q9196_002044 [Gyalolechia fulgens]